MTRFDLVIVGGGINGAAVARDLAGRGAEVYLAERADYAGATSSTSTKLIHGGLRYLEHYEFRLVREALAEREVMLRIAPHLTAPLRFLVPLHAGANRPPWLLWLGLRLYDHLAGRGRLARSGALSERAVAALPHLRRERLAAVLHYPDCWVDDARLTLETLLDARRRGADIGNRREVMAVRADDGGFAVTVRAGGGEDTVHARHLVNAAGPWVNTVLDRIAGGVPERRPLRLVRGSHLVVPMPSPPETDPYTLQMDDGRVVFVLPWLGRFLLIGTTDEPHDGRPEAAHCTAAERDYLLAAYSRFFTPVIAAADVVWSFAGVRPLIDDGAGEAARVSRDYELVVNRLGQGGVITIYGGKLTTHRRVAERVATELARLGLQLGPAWTASALLPGARAEANEAAAVTRGVAPEVQRRWSQTYGAATGDLCRRISATPALAREVAPGVPLAELERAVSVEDARTAEDFLLRRTKLFLTLEPAERTAIERWFAGMVARRTGTA
ncbi:MAG: glycerol-3-phosphate dehydrogenase [Alphaproteobacteria bacterium]|nr:glycerol-3-phosphate dehydrogenase [Alphaproteobacteria bacterium]